MRDISSIKAQALKREEKPFSQTRVRPHEIETLSSRRQDELKKDPIANSLFDGVKINSSLKKAIAKKKVELETVTESVKSVVAGAKAEVDRILARANEDADLMRSEAEKAKKTTNETLDAIKATQIRINEIGRKIEEREGNVNKREVLVGIAEEDVNKKIEESKLLEQESKKRKIEAEKAFVTAVTLLQMATEHLLEVQKLESETTSGVYEMVQKADTMIKRAMDLVSTFDARKVALEKKAVELQDKEKLLTDRQQMLERTAKELKKK